MFEVQVARKLEAQRIAFAFSSGDQRPQVGDSVVVGETCLLGMVVSSEAVRLWGLRKIRRMDVSTLGLSEVKSEMVS